MPSAWLFIHPHKIGKLVKSGKSAVDYPLTIRNHYVNRYDPFLNRQNHYVIVRRTIDCFLLGLLHHLTLDQEVSQNQTHANNSTLQIDVYYIDRRLVGRQLFCRCAHLLNCESYLSVSSLAHFCLTL